jgi:hypothetical protein
VTPCTLARNTLIFRSTYCVHLEGYDSTCMHLVGILRRGISLSQGLNLHRTIQTQNKSKHPCFQWDSNPRSQCLSGEDIYESCTVINLEFPKHGRVERKFSVGSSSGNLMFALRCPLTSRSAFFMSSCIHSRLVACGKLLKRLEWVENISHGASSESITMTGNSL